MTRLPRHSRHGPNGGLLLVGAHAADMEFTAGHLAALHARRGERVTFLHLTAGEAGHPGRERAAYRAQKMEEARNAADLLGAGCQVLCYPDGALSASQDVAEAVAAVIGECRPEFLITHWRGSMHSDHASCHFAVERALARLGTHDPASRPAVFYAENWEDPDGFRPDVLVDVTAVFDDWTAAARCHELFRGGVVSFDYEGYYDALTRMRGCLGGVRRAAAFMRAPPGFSSPPAGPGAGLAGQCASGLPPAREAGDRGAARQEIRCQPLPVCEQSG